MAILVLAAKIAPFHSTMLQSSSAQEHWPFLFSRWSSCTSRLSSGLPEKWGSFFPRVPGFCLLESSFSGETMQIWENHDKWKETTILGFESILLLALLEWQWENS